MLFLSSSISSSSLSTPTGSTSPLQLYSVYPSFLPIHGIHSLYTTILETPVVLHAIKEIPLVKDARLTQMYSFLPASWVGDTHEETDFLPIGDREVKEGRLLVRHSDSLETVQVLVAKYFVDEGFS